MRAVARPSPRGHKRHKRHLTLLKQRMIGLGRAVRRGLVSCLAFPLAAGDALANARQGKEDHALCDCVNRLEKESTIKTRQTKNANQKAMSPTLVPS